MDMNEKNRGFIWAVLALLVFAVSSCSKPSEETSSRKSKPFRLSIEDRKLVREKTARITEPVTINFYTGKPGEKNAAETNALLDLMSTMTSKIKVNELGFSDPSIQFKLETDHGPVMVLEGNSPIGISYYGYPEEMELEPFLDSILIATGQMEPLADSTVSYLMSLDSDVMIRVFATPL